MGILAVNAINEIIALKRQMQLVDEWNVERMTVPNVQPSEEDVLAVEKGVAQPLPTEFRRFICEFDGWNSVSGELHLLSTRQIFTGLGEYANRLYRENRPSTKQFFLPVAVTTPGLDYFSCFGLVGNEFFTDRVLEFNQFSETAEYKDVWAMIEMLCDGLKGSLAGLLTSQQGAASPDSV